MTETEYTSLSDKDIKLVSTIQRRINSTIEILVSDLQYLIDNLEEYKKDMQTSIDASLVEADILTRYHGDKNSGRYNLPSVFSSTVASFDLATMRKDNERLSNATREFKDADDRRARTYTIISQTYQEIRNRLNLLANDNQGISQLVENLKSKEPTI